MSRRRDALERAYDREEERLCTMLDRGEISPEEFSRELRELQRQAQYDARDAMDEDIHDAMEDWR